MVISVTTALELDQKPMSDLFILAEENRTTDGSFVLSTLLDEGLKRGHKIVIILFHNTIGHYHAIGQKMGFNIFEQRDKGNVVVFDFLATIMDKISDNDSASNFDILRNLYNGLKKAIDECISSAPVTLILENVGNLLLLGFQVNAVVFFVHSCKIMMHNLKNLNILCLTHNFPEIKQFVIFTNYLRHISNLNVILDDLETGKAEDITGKLTVKWREENLMYWDEPANYHYQLLDRNIIVFAPGAKNLI